MRKHEPTISIRMVWPFARLLSGKNLGAELLPLLGLDSMATLSNPETRLPYRRVVDIVETVLARAGDPTLGLRAGAAVDFGDFDVLEQAARSAPSLTDAIELMGRYLRVLNEAGELSLTTEGERVIWRYHSLDGAPPPPMINDFIVMAALSFAKRNAASYKPPEEVRFAHERPAYHAEYAKYLQCPYGFGAEENTIVMRRPGVAVPTRAPSPELLQGFSAQADRLLEQTMADESFAARARADVLAHFGSDQPSMQKTARRLGVGVATLRRRLEEEGERFSQLVETLRRTHAERYLRERKLSISEIAFLLGFSDVRAFARAFKRWTHRSPSEYRDERR